MTFFCVYGVYGVGTKHDLCLVFIYKKYSVNFELLVRVPAVLHFVSVVFCAVFVVLLSGAAKARKSRLERDTVGMVVCAVS